MGWVHIKDRLVPPRKETFTKWEEIWLIEKCKTKHTGDCDKNSQCCVNIFLNTIIERFFV